MNAERLLQHYEQIADAPDAVPRLRRFILGLAVRGKLLPQDPADEPASELLKRIDAEKKRLVTAKVIRENKAKAPPPDAKRPCELPTSGWIWVSLSQVGRISGGMTPSMAKPDYWGGTVSWLSPKDIKSDQVSEPELKITELGLSETRLEAYPIGSLFIVARSGILKRTLPVAINQKPAAANQDMKVLVPFLPGMERYLQIMLRGFEGFILSELVKTGTTVQSLKYDEFEAQTFPLPPLAEQHRIVAKVDELMALCDELEAARTVRETKRDRLAAASLARLNTPDPETFRDDARFALDALPALTARPDQIKQLRQTVLNLAVRGKLVPQDPADEPATELLRRIASKKAELVKLGHIKRDKGSDPTEPPFDLPKTWTWCTLGQLSRLITKGSSPKWQGIEYTDKDKGLLFITSENVGNFRLRKLNELKYVESRFKETEPRSMLSQGDLLINLVGASIGRSAIFDLDEEANINQAVALVRMVDPNVAPASDFLLMYLNSDSAVDKMLGSRVVTAQPNISLADVSSFGIPLPPLAEQHRIVAKVDELMALCDQLETSVTSADETRKKLLDALLVEALAPAGATDLQEAAE